ncbi:rolling circle replication-associated protein [Sporolactobacillus putidus]|uniref:Replication-associated protein ORF2/G2P domain-containing protein n=1 Tax=Sporolactobacillus putidus TaxID=492735 RepID=A0A917S7L2_9BACL|nr:replicative protein [Sporolactobacillus putidus]GGL63063.1 hypothetical protein GCM10007968_28730 [Sporolactobacillus putidus]
MRKESKKVVIYNGALVKAYFYGDTLELTTSNGQHKQVIKVLSGKRYANLETGEIKKMAIDANSRADNLKTVKVTMRHLRRLIAHNFQGGVNQLWVTLTYAANVTEPAIAYKDYKAFMKRVRKLYSDIDYISVIEPQASGRWHYHVLMKSNEKKLMIPNSKMQELWGKGYTKTKRLKRSDKVANYVLAYLSNLDIPTDDRSGRKCFVKGARLYLYPKGLRIYRRSKGIEDPIEKSGIKHEILEQSGISDRHADFATQTIHVGHDTYKGEITYITEFFNNIERNDDIEQTKGNKGIDV